MCELVEYWNDAVGGNAHPERTLKAEVLAEWEAISRLAKRRWAEERGHDCISLQHDGIVLALAAGCTVADVTLHLRDASARALGYPMAVLLRFRTEGVQPLSLLSAYPLVPTVSVMLPIGASSL